MQSKHNLNISGGTKTARYFINVGYYTVVVCSRSLVDYDFGYQYNSFNYRANLDLDVTKTTTISFNLAGKVDNANKPYSGQGSSGLINEAYQVLHSPVLVSSMADTSPPRPSMRIAVPTSSLSWGERYHLFRQ